MADETNKAPEIPADHFSNSLTHEKLTTPEAKQVLSKFKTQEDVNIGYIELQKSLGKPFKFPENPDKLDDKTKGEFTASLHKAIGAVEKPEELKDINWTDGMPEGSKADEGLQAAISKLATEKHWPKSVVQDGVKWWNGLAAQAKEQQKLEEQKKEQAKLDKMKAANEYLVKTFGGEKQVAEGSELVKRMFAKLVPADQYEQAGDELVDSGMTTNPVLASALIKLANTYYKEGATESGEGREKPKTPEMPTVENNPNIVMPKTAAALGLVDKK